ncbi:undecaprenyl-diphosphatase [Geodermatophilus telluris]|uniref:Undecaprenyl-diphosphatase n=1 Tax=Geodermatophilus telluris TaxID=1190417 RepID=A0A1G6L8Z5_9ACTN|nr:bifunctional phosphatase PAP2/diacylglycerol kinase family protein [Geodermatophilus telluris]SDC39734.1 undecaprenyl-diphosphatase [Geodermatophilus telluris]
MTPLRLRYWDARLHAAIGALPDSPADRWLRRLSMTADHGKLWFGVALLLGLRRGPLRRGAVRGVGSLAVASTVVNAVLKRLVGRVRPDLANLASHRRLPRAHHTFSFPSGHSSSAGAFATGVALESPLAGAALAPLALAVGYSRVHVGVHYPGDVVSGLAIGTGVALAGRRWWPVRPTEPARVRPASAAPALPGGAGLVVAVNPRSGPDGYDPAAEVRELLPAAEVLTASPERGVGELLADAARAGGVRALGVAGGDGSMAAAAAVALEHGLPLVVVPAGTLNHFARDLGVETPQEAAAAVEEGRAVCVDVAEVNGVPFLNTASIGVYPEMVRRRDALEGRLGRWLATAVSAAQVLRGGAPVSMVVDGRPVEVWVLFVGNCRYTPRGLAPAWRPRLEDGLLDVQYLRADVPFSRTRAVLGALLGVSDRSSGYATAAAPEVRVQLWSGPEPLAYDGETAPATSSFLFRKRPSLTVYCSRTD